MSPFRGFPNNKAPFGGGFIKPPALRVVDDFHIPEKAVKSKIVQRMGENYLKDIKKNSRPLVRRQKGKGTAETQSFIINKSKPIIDQIDTILSQHYDFTQEELDFIINYDIKYRMGKELESGEGNNT